MHKQTHPHTTFHVVTFVRCDGPASAAKVIEGARRFTLEPAAAGGRYSPCPTPTSSSTICWACTYSQCITTLIKKKDTYAR